MEGAGCRDARAAAIDGCDRQSSDAAATAAANKEAGNAGRGTAAAGSADARVDGLMHRLGGMVMETLGVSLVTCTAEEGAIETAPARAAAVFMAMRAAREASIKEIGVGGDDVCRRRRPDASDGGCDAGGGRRRDV